MSTIFAKRLEERTRVVESLVAEEQWKQDHQDAQFALDVQDLVAECIEHQEFLAHQFNDSLQRIVDGRAVDVRAISELLLEQLERGIRAFAKAENLVQEAHALRHTIEREPEFRRGAIETKKRRHRILSRWPLRNEEQNEHAMQEYREGRFRTAKEVSDDLLRGCSGERGAKG